MNSYSGINAVIFARASSSKQVEKGDTIEAQVTQCREYARVHDIKIQKVYKVIESARKDEREEFRKIIDYCIDRSNNVNMLLFRDISRLTHQGGSFYEYLKKKLADNGVSLQDTFDTIQPPVNVLEEYGVQYPWSMKSPSQRSELYEAERKRDEVFDFLRRAIPAEIRYEREGYSARRAEFGYQNVKIEEQGRVRSVRIPNPPESDWVKEIFELRAKNTLSDDEIVKRLNKSGFQTRKYKKRDRNTREVLGFSGGNKLTMNELKRIVRTPVYAGVVSGKWIQQPFLSTKFKG